jgi:phosphoserine phosphatase RsbU/P
MKFDFGPHGVNVATKEPRVLDEGSLLQSVLDCLEEGILLLDRSHAVKLASKTAAHMLGYEEAELIGRKFESLVERGPDAGLHERAWNRLVLRAKDPGLAVAFCRFRDLDAERVLVELRAEGSQPAVSAAIGEIKEKLGAVFDPIPDGIIIISEAGEIQLFSSGAEKMFGYGRNEVQGRNVRMLMPSPFREAHDGYLSSYVETGVKRIIGIGREVVGRRKDGSNFPIYLSIGELWLGGVRHFVGVTHDLTNRKQAEEKLLTLSAAMDQSPVAVIIASREGLIEYVNESFTRLTGYAAEEIVGRNPRVLRSQHTASHQYRRLWRAIAGGREWSGEIQDRRKNGELYWAKETITPMKNARGEISHYLAIQQDITQEKLDKEALKESEARFRHVAQLTGEWLWEQDPDGRYVYSSAAVRKILGYSPSEIIGRSYRDLQTAEREEVSAPSIHPKEDFRPFYRLVNRYRHRNGKDVYTESSGAPILDDAGRLAKWRGVDHDITEHKAFEDALRLRDRAIESVHVGVAISDGQKEGNPNIYVNPALCIMTGYSREELLGKSLKLLRGPETDPGALDQISQAIAAGRDCTVDLRYYRKNGQPFWCELLISPVMEENGKVSHHVGIYTDVTERRRADESRHELEIAKGIQLSLLPGAPLRVPQAEFAGICVPAGQVGGDYFDFFYSSDSADVVIADVSGHSVGAALIMTVVRSTLRAEARRMTEVSTSPAQILQDLAELLYEDLNRAELFITMFYMKLDPGSRVLTYANAGHNWALLLKRDESDCVLLDADGLIMGVRPRIDFEEKKVQLSKGDLVLLYTDGVTEAQNGAGEFFGLERLCEALKASRSLPPEKLIQNLLDDVYAFCENRSLEDDLAIVAMKVR